MSQVKEAREDDTMMMRRDSSVAHLISSYSSSAAAPPPPPVDVLPDDASAAQGTASHAPAQDNNNDSWLEGWIDKVTRLLKKPPEKSVAKRDVTQLTPPLPSILLMPHKNMTHDEQPPQAASKVEPILKRMGLSSELLNYISSLEEPEVSPAFLKSPALPPAPLVAPSPPVPPTLPPNPEDRDSIIKALETKTAILEQALEKSHQQTQKEILGRKSLERQIALITSRIALALEKMADEKKEALQEIQRLKGLMDTHLLENASLKEQLEGFVKEKSSLREQLEAFMVEKSSLREQLDVFMVEKSHLTEQVKELSKEKKGLESKVKEMTSKLQSATSPTSPIKSKSEQTQLQLMNAEINALRKGLQNERKDFERVRNEMLTEIQSLQMAQSMDVIFFMFFWNI
jgi:ribosomal protein S15P/S13E